MVLIADERHKQYQDYRTDDDLKGRFRPHQCTQNRETVAEETTLKGLDH